MRTDSSPARLTLSLPGNGKLLPNELLWLNLFAPLAVAPLIIRNLFELELRDAIQKIGGVYLPFIVLTLSFYTLYHYVVPRFIWHLRSPVQRAMAHAALITVVALVLGAVLTPVYRATCDKSVDGANFVMDCVIISWATMIPALIVQRLRNRAQHVEQLALVQRQAALEAQLAALQARTNPHFFFNTINTVAALIPDDPSLAERTLEQLADVFRYALDASKIKTVPLKRELAMIEDYLGIQAARFGQKLQTSIECDDSIANVEVPPLLLQPLVENAILHGMQHRERGQVHVTARRVDDRVVVEVRDDGPGPSRSTHQGTQTSVKEIKERLKLMYGERAFFELSPIDGGGCSARIAIPLGAVS